MGSQKAWNYISFSIGVAIFMRDIARALATRTNI